MHGRKIRRHQSNRLEQAREQPRLGNGFMQEDAAIKRLMLGAHDRQSEIGVRIFARHIGQAERHIGQFGQPPRLVGIGNKSRSIDNDLAAVEPGQQNFTERLRRA